MGKPKADTNQPEINAKKSPIAKNRITAPWKKAKTPDRVTIVKEVFGTAGPKAKLSEKAADAVAVPKPSMVSVAPAMTSLAPGPASTPGSAAESVKESTKPSSAKIIQNVDEIEAAQEEEEEDDANKKASITKRGISAIWKKVTAQGKQNSNEKPTAKAKIGVGKHSTAGAAKVSEPADSL